MQATSWIASNSTQKVVAVQSAMTMADCMTVLSRKVETCLTLHLVSSRSGYCCNVLDAKLEHCKSGLAMTNTGLYPKHTICNIQSEMYSIHPTTSCDITPLHRCRSCSMHTLYMAAIGHQDVSDACRQIVLSELDLVTHVLHDPDLAAVTCCSC